MTDNEVKKGILVAKALSIIEGACFFVAGICAIMSGSILGYISGGLMIILACCTLLPTFVGGDEYFVNTIASLVENDDLDEYGERVEESKNENANG